MSKKSRIPKISITLKYDNHYMILAWYLLYDTGSIILALWYSLYYTRYMILAIWYSLWYSLYDTRYRYSLYDTCYMILSRECCCSTNVGVEAMDLSCRKWEFLWKLWLQSCLTFSSIIIHQQQALLWRWRSLLNKRKLKLCLRLSKYIFIPCRNSIWHSPVILVSVSDVSREP